MKLLNRIWTWLITSSVGSWIQRIWTNLHDTGHMDASKITNQLWVGGAITTIDEVRDLALEGITAVIDCRLEEDDKSLIDGYNEEDVGPTHPGLKKIGYYLYAGVADDGQPKPLSWFQQIWDFAEPLLKDSQVIYCHCAAGVNRGPSCGYFLLRAYWKMSGDSAFNLLKTQRPVVNVAYRDDADKAITALGLG